MLVKQFNFCCETAGKQTLRFKKINANDKSNLMITNFENNFSYAQKAWCRRWLKRFSWAVYIPKHQGKESIYFNGNSLGLQPKSTLQYLQQELDDWARLSVDGHFDAINPWVTYHEILTRQLCNIVGALPHEVVAMNSLTVNLHLLMVSFTDLRKTLQDHLRSESISFRSIRLWIAGSLSRPWPWWCHYWSKAKERRTLPAYIRHQMQ